MITVKALFKNKKIKTGVIATMVGATILMASLTNAWFTSAGVGGNNDVNMGNLKVTAALVNHDGLVVKEPGIVYGDQVGVVQNLGNVPAIAKLTFDVEMYSQFDGWVPVDPSLIWVEPQVKGTYIDETTSYTVDDGKGNEIEIHRMGDWYSEDGTEFYTWGQLDGDLYVGMLGNDELHFAYQIVTDGVLMDDAYQNAQFRVSINWEATQLNSDGAINEIFGLSDGFFSINWFALTDPDLVQTGLTTFGFNPLIAVYAETLENLPDSGFKTYLMNALGITQ